MDIPERKDLRGASLERANLKKLTLKGLTFKELTFKELTLKGDLKRAQHLSLDQLSKVKTLHDTKLNEKIHIPLKKKYPTLFEKPDE